MASYRWNYEKYVSISSDGSKRNMNFARQSVLFNFDEDTWKNGLKDFIKLLTKNDYRYELDENKILKDVFNDLNNEDVLVVLFNELINLLDSQLTDNRDISKSFKKFEVDNIMLDLYLDYIEHIANKHYPKTRREFLHLGIKSYLSKGKEKSFEEIVDIFTDDYCSQEPEKFFDIDMLTNDLIDLLNYNMEDEKEVEKFSNAFNRTVSFTRKVIRSICRFIYRYLYTSTTPVMNFKGIKPKGDDFVTERDAHIYSDTTKEDIENKVSVRVAYKHNKSYSEVVNKMDSDEKYSIGKLTKEEKDLIFLKRRNPHYYDYLVSTGQIKALKF